MTPETGERRKKIVLVHDRFPPDYAGGGEYIVLMLAKLLLEQGLDVHVITAGDPGDSDVEGIPVRRLRCSSYQFNFKWKEVAQYAHDADLIQCFTYHGLRPAYKAARHLNIPVVNMVLAQFGDAWYGMKGRMLGWLFVGMERYLLNLPCDATVYLSDFSRELSEQVSPGLPNKSIIEPGISLENYFPGDTREYVFFAGKFEGRKGISVVTECARRSPDIPFKMMGWGDSDQLDESVIPGNLEVIEYTSRLDLARYLSRARVFVFPTRVETFGLALVEAMASGCAVVSSSKLPFAGTKVAAEDTEAFITAIRDLWFDTKLCESHGRENIRRAQHYNWQRSIQKLMALYESLLNQGSSKSYEDSHLSPLDIPEERS